MARACTICTDPRCVEINRALVDGTADTKAMRGVAAAFGVGREAIRRHAKNHLTDGFKKTLAMHSELIRETQSLDVVATLGKLADQALRMATACHEYLEDPEAPGKYKIVPRTHEVDIVYEEQVGERTVRKVAKLSELLAKVETGLGISVIKAEPHVMDPRKLMLDTIDSLKPVVELIGKATGQIKDKVQTVQAVQVVLRLEPDQRPSGVVIEGDR